RPESLFGSFAHALIGDEVDLGRRGPSVTSCVPDETRSWLGYNGDRGGEPAGPWRFPSSD
ncbi:MAG: hypothetical protein AAGA56_18100, partial [Myxococcota bacterium]